MSPLAIIRAAPVGIASGGDEERDARAAGDEVRPLSPAQGDGEPLRPDEPAPGDNHRPPARRLKDEAARRAPVVDDDRVPPAPEARDRLAVPPQDDRPGGADAPRQQAAQ